MRRTLAFVCALVASSSFTFGEPPPLESKKISLPGMQAGGAMLLPNQWSLNPAGKQLALGDFPTTICLHPEQNFAAVLHSGYGEHEVVIVDTKQFKTVSRVSMPQTFVGMCFSHDGKELFCSGSEKEVVYRYNFDDGFLHNPSTIQITEVRNKQVPAGLALSPDGKHLFAACPWGQSVCKVTLDGSQKPTFSQLETDAYPYWVTPTGDGKRLFVSLWGQASVAVLNLETLKVDAKWPTQANPTEMWLTHDEATLYVACANSNTVYVFDTASGKTLEVISSALFPKADNGSTPNSISLSPDEKALLIANATNNNVALIDVSERGHSRSLGFIPVGWYPTCARFNPHDGTILVSNGKGLGSKANRQGPNPLNSPPKSLMEYIGGLFEGTLSQIVIPSPGQLKTYTKTAYQCSPLRDDKQPIAVPSDPKHPIPSKVGDPSPIKYCIYIVKENRTYDQVLGDLPQGNGESSLCIFPRQVTPNHHALAEQFVVLDNFYVESEVSADGHEWSMAAYANDFVERTWPLTYRGSREGKLKYPAEGAFHVARPSSGYLWDRAKQAGVSYRSYGEFVVNGKLGEPGTTRMEALHGHFDPLFRSYDLDYSDQLRADRFIAELQRFENEGDMPRLQIVRLPNDHTHGTSRGKPTPTAMVADNDLAFGRLVEAVSKSKFWKETAIFVVEDDAQNGSDHVDAHRTVALAISPYVRRGSVDSTLYSTSSMLRTMELILGIEPMTQFDAAANPMFACFGKSRELKPFLHLPAQVDLDAVNSALAWGAAQSEMLNFAEEDAADDLLLGDIVWRSVRGAGSPMPPPVRAAFVFANNLEEESEHK